MAETAKDKNKGMRGSEQGEPPHYFLDIITPGMSYEHFKGIFPNQRVSRDLFEVYKRNAPEHAPKVQRKKAAEKLKKSKAKLKALKRKHRKERERDDPQNMNPRYHFEGQKLVLTEGAKSGGSIKKGSSDYYAHGGSVRKTKLSDY